ncbi:NAD(P)-dependent dehydrogenase (short-subunit alcohol dehydrogenase family) [Variovorax boronicumulans]|uniref:NAD(P)-dependent dehydrogenase (Short-subunit alcohol dehydrogenase family) n=1 Tax=Variovorax boronicumulans TaxID=436515 RepID=A0AAW8DTH0_9BURK|nr:SDR family NAD(P)-dependent oxidoreductase [Variovorax boronicumulans]MDP9877343.1 NAD(P)-dependent dehydrogenase (short-subunit alcohol dehydrogenase family) [Variovorax boronicumulans]MDP9922629.1 NAD(P)-dependent dehydrogenase (short-subunit alcohol dehydrogenase family) [Variovorax boronicumulans]
MSDAARPLLQGRVAVITGASRARGIGLATARLFARHGARVALLDLDEGQVQAAAESLGDEHIGIGCDVRDAGACKAAVARVQQWAGRIDVLVNNAAITQKRDVLDVSAEDFEQVVGIALRGTLQMSQCVIPTMVDQRSGSIICISSMSAQQGGGVFGGSHYCAAKAGVLGLMRAIAKELGPQGIRANAITPGLIMTDFSRGANSDDNKHALGKTFPLGRVGQPKDIAGACLYLASDLSSFVTGATLDVNGGAYMR